MALLNFEKDPADVRAALPRELMRRTICCAGDFGDTASSPGLNLVSTESRCCGFRRKNDGQDNLNLDFQVVRSVRGTLLRSLGDLVAFVSLDVEVMVVEIGDRASSKSDPVLFLAFR